MPLLSQVGEFFFAATRIYPGQKILYIPQILNYNPKYFRLAQFIISALQRDKTTALGGSILNLEIAGLTNIDLNRT